MRASIHFISRDDRDEELPVSIYVNETENQITLEATSKFSKDKSEMCLSYQAWRDIVHVIKKMGLDRWE